jgi:hypothetical protein
VYKWKARLKFDGSRQIFGEYYWDTYAPVANWESIRLVLLIAIVTDWHSSQIDFIQSYTQANVEMEMYIAIPKGFKVS